MTQYTVLGVYDDSAQCFSHPVEAATPYEAMQKAALEMEGNDELCIIGAIEGRHKLVTPGEDNGLCAFACDLIDLEG